MIARVLAVSILAMASAEQQYPAWQGGGGYVDSMGATRGQTTENAGPVCQDEDSFFARGLSASLLQHPEFDGSDVKIALGRNKKFYSVDVPFSHEANALSLAEVESDLIPLDYVPEDPEEQKADAMRAKIRAKHAWKVSTSDNAKKDREAELEVEKADLKKHKNDQKPIDVYYVNMDNQKERKNCLERQFTDMPGKPVPKRFSAIQFPTNCAKAKTHQDYELCLNQAGLSDCIESGIDYAATGTHGTQIHGEHSIRNNVLSNWCGHKRLFNQLEQDSKNGTGPEYVVILEDDVILDRKYFMKVIKDFAIQYQNRDWDLVQLDPFGHKDKKDLIEQFRGKPVFKPAADSQCSAYWGFHAVLIKTSALKRINHWMTINRAVPIDWLPWRMPHVLAYSALVSRNPEATLKGGTIVLPKYCSAKVMKSTIG